MAHFMRTALHVQRCLRAAGIVAAHANSFGAHVPCTAAFTAPLRCPLRHAGLLTTSSVWERGQSPRRGSERRRPQPLTTPQPHEQLRKSTEHLHYRRRQQQQLRRHRPCPQRVEDDDETSDRERRRRALRDAVDAAVAFRWWCHAHSPPRTACVQPQHTHAAAATLADVTDACGVDHQTCGSSDATPSLPTSIDVPAKERQLLEHYAGLLHAVRVAAMRVATSDYLRLYDRHVGDLLAAATPQEWRPVVPRTAAWSDAVHAVDGSTAGEDATTQAERRLMAWAACWYAEVRHRHTRPREGTSDATLVDDAAEEGVAVRGGAADDDGDDGALRGPAGVDASLTRLLLRGRWQHAMRLLRDRIESDGDAGAPLAQQPGAAAAQPSDACATAAVSDLFTTARLQRRRRVPVQPRATTRTPTLPRRLATAPVTAAEVRLLQHPPSPGLRVSIARSPFHRDTAAAAAAAASAEVQAARAAAAPPSRDEVLRLRRRLWVLRHLPRHLPPSLVRFREAAQRRRGGRGAVPQPYLLRSAALEWLPWYPLCVLGRVLALTLEGAADGSEQGAEAEVARVLQAARSDLAAALFATRPPGDYAALHDYTHALFVTLGSGMLDAAVAGACRHDQQQHDKHSTALTPGHRTCDGAVGVRAERHSLAAERVFAQTAVSLFAPPPAATYAEAASTEKAARPVTATATTTDINTEAGAATASGSAARGRSRRATPRDGGSDTGITATHPVSRDTLACLCAAAQDWRNYHVSLYCETLSQIADGHGLALATLTATLAHSAPCVVLAPESAAAVLTALVLQQLAQPAADGVPATIFFAVPHDKAHGVAAYFKGAFDAAFFARVVPAAAADGSCAPPRPHTPQASESAEETHRKVCHGAASLTLSPAGWHTSATARLAGRSLRRLDRYPTRTTDAFFAGYVRGDDTAFAEAVPPLAVDLYVLNLNAAVAHWQRRRAGCGGECSAVHRPSSAASSLVGDGAGKGKREIGVDGGDVGLLAGPPPLPYGLHALVKPAGVTCTLHARYPCLVYPYLTLVLPWRAPPATPTTSPATGSVPVPVLRQQGLVNRIDVGTSGVVLVARTPAALHAAADATVRQHRVHKTYRALVQRWPPPTAPAASRAGGAAAASCTGASSTPAAALPLFHTSPHLCPVAASVVRAPVFAAGADAASLRRRQLRHGHAGQLALESAASDASSPLPLPQSPPQPGQSLMASPSTDSLPAALTHAHEGYATTHAALQDVRPAVTRYRVLEHFASAGVSYVEVQLSSGRRHQIRQHFALLGFPLLGDARYHAGVVAGLAGTTYGMQRAALHAHAVDILVADDDASAAEEEVGELGRVVVHAPLPADMRRALQRLREAERTVRASAPAPQPPPES